MKQAWRRMSGVLAVVGVVAFATGCGTDQSSTNVAATQLQQSYESADAPIKQEVARARAALQSGDYAAAIITMERVTKSQPIDEAQKKAVGVLIQQTRQAVKQNPKLNSPELYKAMSDLVTRVHGEN